MKRNAYLMVTTVLVVGLVNGCDINPFSPPSEPLPATDSSSSGNGGNGSGGMGSGGGAGCKCADDGNECTVDVPGDCPNGDPTACHLPAAAGTVCAMGVCNGAGQCGDCTTCTEATCLGRCNGISCTAANQCSSGLCEQSTCCEAACSGPCQTCSKDGVAGTCTRMPVGLQVTGCDGAMICDANGACVAKTMAALGTLCNTSSQCMSGVCRREYCQSPVGEPCVEDLECTTNLCDPTTKTCKSCSGAGAGTCTAGSSCDMATGNCKVFLGQPAASDAECVSGTVIQFLCSLPSGAACTAHHDCVGRNCVNGVCTAQCSMASQCADGGPCSMNGVCGMVAGEYCVVNEHCKSGNCSGFPRRCQ